MTETDRATAPYSSRSLTYHQTIDRTLVHRASIHEVFITDTRMIDPDTCLVGAQLPRRHALYSDRVRDAYDPLLLLEICRQSSIAMAHRYFAVPPDWAFVLRKADVRAVGRDLLRVTDRPADVVVRIRVRRAVVHESRFAGAFLSQTVCLDGEPLAQVQGLMKCLSQDDYLALRSGAGESVGPGADHSAPQGDPFPATGWRRIDPADLARHDPRNVVIGDGVGAGRRAYPVTVDATHPSLFDHAVDHVPGVLLVEACRQASFRHVTRGLGITGPPLDAWELGRFTMDFTGFAEIGAPLHCVVTDTATAGDGAAATVALDVVQGRARLGRTSVLWCRD